MSRVLRLPGMPFTALEVSTAQVDFVRQFGNEIYYGDATRLDLLNAAWLREARVLVIAMDGLEDSLRLARMVRETLPSGIAMARAVLESLGVAPEASEEIVTFFRPRDEELLQRQLAVFHDDAESRQSAREFEIIHVNK